MLKGKGQKIIELLYLVERGKSSVPDDSETSNPWPSATPVLQFLSRRARNTLEDLIVITTIEIIQEQHDAQQAVYRAIKGDQQAESATPGQALDTLERLLAVQGKAEDEGMLIIVQRFRPDAFFTAEQQQRLEHLMSRLHDACNTGQDLSPEEKQELEQLVDAEWQAAIERGAAILKRIPRSAT